MAKHDELDEHDEVCKYGAVSERMTMRDAPERTDEGIPGRKNLLSDGRAEENNAREVQSVGDQPTGQKARTRTASSLRGVDEDQGDECGNSSA
mgnify:FL=1